MHGRPRQPPRAMTPEEVAKIEKYTKHKNMALAAKKKQIINPATLALTSSLLTINPDFYTLFNFRKEQVLDLVCAPDADIVSIWSAELELSTTALQKQPKSYAAWYHRQWCIEHAGAYIDIAKELSLCTRFLSMDARNFHCWNYRRYLARIGMGAYSRPASSPAERNSITDPDRAALVSSLFLPFTDAVCSPESELRYTTVKIAADFSNYSAWHYRSLLLPLVLLRIIYGIAPDTYLQHNAVSQLHELSSTADPETYTPSSPFIPASTSTSTSSTPSSSPLSLPYTLPRPATLLSSVSAVLGNELSLARHAYSIVPKDQSPWLYHRWLCGVILALSHENGREMGAAGVEDVSTVSSAMREFTPFTRIPEDMIPAVIPTSSTSTSTSSSSSSSVSPAQSIISSLTPILHPRFRRAVTAVQARLLTEDAKHLRVGLGAGEGPGVLLAMEVLKRAVDEVAGRAEGDAGAEGGDDADGDASGDCSWEDADVVELCAGVAGADDDNIEGIKGIFRDESETVRDVSACTSSVPTYKQIVAACRRESAEIEALGCLKMLKTQDPMRKGFYDAIAK